MNIDQIQKTLSRVGLIIRWPALPVFFVYLWWRDVNLYAHSKVGSELHYLLFIFVFCVVSAIVYAIRVLLRWRKADMILMIYWLTLILLAVGLGNFSDKVIFEITKRRVESEMLFAECEKTAHHVDNLGFYNVCESSDMSYTAIGISFREIIYDTSDQIILFSEHRPKISGSFVELTSKDKMLVRRITGNYYLVDGYW